MTHPNDRSAPFIPADQWVMFLQCCKHAHALGLHIARPTTGGMPYRITRKGTRGCLFETYDLDAVADWLADD